MTLKKEDTPRRISRRKYETHRKKDGPESAHNFQTFIPLNDYEEIDKFLKENKITKVDLIYAGYAYLKMQQEEIKKDK